MNQGWIKLYRDIMDDDLWFSERLTKAQAWLELQLLANHKPSRFFKRGIEIRLKRGQLARSIKELSDRWKWNPRTVKKFLVYLAKVKKLHFKSSNVTTIITIINWDIEQGYTKQNAGQSRSSVHSKVHTYNNDKNVSNNGKTRRYREIIDREKEVLKDKERERKEAENFRPDFAKLREELFDA